MTAPQFRSVDQHTGEVASSDALAEARAEIAYYADLNKVLGEALKRATDTAANAVIQEQELRDELDDLKRDAQELWERAMRAGELERQLHAARAELSAQRHIVAAAAGIR